MRSIKKILLTLSLLASAVISAPSQAALLDAPLPDNAYITMNGLDWAWALPLPANNGLDLSYQSAYGWRLPTLAELLSAPNATDFMFAGANVPFGGSDPVSGAFFSATNPNLTGDAACASPYFNNSYSHCDWQDGNGQLYVWAGLPNAPSWADQLVVRNSQVPEPSTVALTALALFGFAASRRKAK